MNSLELITVRAGASIDEAFRKLNENRQGVVFAVDEHGRVLGCVTDGDIRRQLLANKDLGIAISSFMNTGFVRAHEGTPREQILKLLDHRVRVVPLLDSQGRLSSICSRENFDIEGEGTVFARARAPARVSFGGGGTDLTQYFVNNGGVVINATICKFAHAALRKRSDASVRIYSHDLKKTVSATSVADLNFDGELDLIKSVIKLIQPRYGFDLEISADFPVGSGLGGSAVVATAVIGGFNEFRSDPWDRHQIAEMAFQAERLILDIPGGWQDQYATVFGGFNYMEFDSRHNTIIPLRLEPRVLHELEESVVLCYTGQSHNSGAIHSDQKSRIGTSGGYEEAARKQKDLTEEMKRNLLRGDLNGYGRLLHRAWEVKREFSPMISDSRLDSDYEHALAHGAIGGKILGAGGGGYFLFFVPPFARYGLTTALEERGYSCERVLFDKGGLCSWKVREHGFRATGQDTA